MIDICFNMLNSYEDMIKKSLLKEGINEENADKIINDFIFKRDLMISLNKEYLKGSYLKDFCNRYEMSIDIPQLLNFNGTLYRHQEEAIKSIIEEKCTIISTGTGSGKTESFLVPILDYCLKNKGRQGIKAIIIYPMNALAGDQVRRISAAVKGTGITFGIFTGESPIIGEEYQGEVRDGELVYREEMVSKKPDILITNYVMLDRLLTNPKYNDIFRDSKFAKYIVLDEIHIYRGNKGLHIKYLLHRLRYSLENKVVQIGCSATLSRNKKGKKIEGYLSGEIENFIKVMFNVSNERNYSYIEPIYEDIINKKNIYGNQECNEIANSKITKILKEYLSTGCKSFDEILESLNNRNIKITREKLSEYFKQVLNANLKSKGNPVLDFRVHMFLLNIEGSLKRCTSCNKYYTDNINICNECGNLILPIYKNNSKYLVGVLREGFIVPPDSKVAKSNPIVLLDLDNDSVIDSNFNNFINFEDFLIVDEKLELIFDRDGQKKMYLLQTEEGELNDYIINLNDNNKETFLYEIIKEPLLTLEGSNKKLLAFIDNREKSSRLSVVLGDRFISEFYYEILKYVYSINKEVSIKELVKEAKIILSQYINNQDKLSEEVAKGILNEFMYWVIRFLKEIKKKSITEYKDIIPIVNSDELTEEENMFINIAIEEGAFGSEFHLDKEINTRYIRLNVESILRQKYLGFRSESNLGNVMSFSNDGRKYRGIIEKISLEDRRRILKRLKDKGLLREYKAEGSNNSEDCIYSLNSNAFRFDLDESEYSSINEIINKYLLFTGVHNSEVSNKQRKDYERQFQESELNLLLCTPTLEMGIDIGNLSFVYMLGIPPMPSNYAQRAGRAGRRGNKFAALINICSEKSQHDWYYFNNPKAMIEGTITPPKFDVNNVNVLNKHVNTFIIPTLEGIIDFITDEKKQKIKQKCEKVFGCKVDIAALKSEYISS